MNEENKNFEEILKSALSAFKSDIDKRFDEMKVYTDTRFDGMDKDIKELKKITSETLSYVKHLDEDISTNKRAIDNLQERVSKLDGLKYTDPELVV